MHLVQILLPLYDNNGSPIAREAFIQLREELTARFGGTTSHVRAPATGFWKDDQGGVSSDDVVIVEVMVETLEPGWWARYRRNLENRFGQHELVIRAIAMSRL